MKNDEDVFKVKLATIDQKRYYQAVAFTKLVRPNKLSQFSFIDFHYFQNQSFSKFKIIKFAKPKFFQI